MKRVSQKAERHVGPEAPASTRKGPKSRAQPPPKPTDRREELVRAAYDLIATKGLEGLRTRDIAAQVGINISTLHYHFDTKEALIAGVVEYVAHLFKTMHAPLPPGATALDELYHLFGGQARGRRADSNVDAVMQEIMLRSRRDVQIRRAFDQMLRTWRAIVEDIVTRCIQEGLLRSELDAKTVTAVITSFQIGANLQLGIAPGAFQPHEAGRSFVSWLVAPAANRLQKARR